MQLQELKNTEKRKKQKRVGRGGKRGTYSGKGQKGQRSRAGHKILPAEMNLIAKFPKLRGIKNKSIQKKPVILNVGNLVSVFKGVSHITKKSFLEKKLIRRLSQPVKILGAGTVKGAITIEGITVSKQAKEKITAAGGTIK
jgi:large subunit ribosomal protein L15